MAAAGDRVEFGEPRKVAADLAGVGPARRKGEASAAVRGGSGKGEV